MNVPDVCAAQLHLQRLFDACGDGSGKLDAGWVMAVVTKAREALSEGIAASPDEVQNLRAALDWALIGLTSGLGGCVCRGGTKCDLCKAQEAVRGALATGPEHKAIVSDEVQGLREEIAKFPKTADGKPVRHGMNVAARGLDGRVYENVQIMIQGVEMECTDPSTDSWEYGNHFFNLKLCYDDPAVARAVLDKPCVSCGGPAVGWTLDEQPICTACAAALSQSSSGKAVG